MRPAKFPYLEHSGVLAFAHRGGANAHPENTMPAFEHAVSLGYRYIETDVHVTKDGVLLAFHDDKLDRVTDRKGIIAEMTYDEIRGAKVAGQEPIPLMAELFDAFPDVKINIDPKADASVAPLIKAIREAGALERVGIGSFSDARLAEMRAELGPGLCTSMGPVSTARLRFGSWSGPLGFLWGGFAAGCAQLPVSQYGIPLVNQRLVEHAHELGLQVHVWTIDDPAEMRRLLDIGVDGLMTDELEVLKSVLEARGQWE